MDSGIVPAVADHDGAEVDGGGEGQGGVLDECVLGEEIAGGGVLVWYSAYCRNCDTTHSLKIGP